MKKKVITILIIVILVIVAIISNIDFKSKDDAKITDAVKFKNEYEDYNDKINEYNQKKYLKLSIPKDNIVKYVNAKETLDILQNKTGVIYIGFPSCPWCRNIVPVLLNAASSTGVARINYLDATNLRDQLALNENNEVIVKKEGATGYQELLKELDEILDEYILTTEDGKKIATGEKRIYVPLVIFVQSGKIVSYHVDTVESQKDPYIKLNNEQTEELFNIYVDGILKMQDSACDDAC